MTHKELVERARTWLHKTVRCGVVLVEWTGGPRETPDAIGWKHFRTSFLVEVKISKTDFIFYLHLGFNASSFSSHWTQISTRGCVG